MLWNFVVCFGFPFACGGAFLLLPNFNHIYVCGSASPPYPPHPHRYLCVCPEVNDMVVCLGGGLPLLAFTHRRRYYGEASGAQLNFAQDGANLPENCDGACVLSGSSPFFHALMPCLYCGMPNGISIIFRSANVGKYARCTSFLVFFELFCSLRGRRELEVVEGQACPCGVCSTYDS